MLVVSNRQSCIHSVRAALLALTPIVGETMYNVWETVRWLVSFIVLGS